MLFGTLQDPPTPAYGCSGGNERVFGTGLSLGRPMLQCAQHSSSVPTSLLLSDMTWFQ